MPKAVAAMLMSIGLVCGTGAQAQTACPSGVGPGSAQCGPDSGTSRGYSAPPRPTGYWIKTWGAIAGSVRGNEGWSTAGQFSEREARENVLLKCTSSGATDCTVDMTYFNQCVAMAVAPTLRAKGSIFTGEDEQTASTRALESCEKRHGEPCKVTFTQCTDPVFNKY